MARLEHVTVDGVRIQLLAAGGLVLMRDVDAAALVRAARDREKRQDAEWQAILTPLGLGDAGAV